MQVMMASRISSASGHAADEAIPPSTGGRLAAACGSGWFCSAVGTLCSWCAAWDGQVANLSVFRFTCHFNHHFIHHDVLFNVQRCMKFFFKKKIEY